MSLLLSLLIQAVGMPQTGMSLPEPPSACLIHLEGDYDIKRRLEEVGCAQGDSLVLYNHSTTGRWQIILPVRAAAAMVCDMSQPISAIGAVGSQPYQSVVCVYSGQVRAIKTNDSALRGWASVF